MKGDSSYGQVISLPSRKRTRAPEAAPRHVLADVFPGAVADPAATGLVLSMLPATGGPILWVQDRLSGRENGYPYAPGLVAFGVDRPILRVAVGHPRDVLWAMEEGAACGALSAVVGEIHGAPAVLDFTATKRLALRSEASGVPVWLIRSGDPGGLSAARQRWRVTSLPSFASVHDAQAPGQARWDAELFRARGRPPGRWVAHHDPGAQGSADRLRLVSDTDDRTLDAGHQHLSDRAGP